MPKVVIVGAGVSGLATAAFLHGLDLSLLEASAEPGGNVRSDHIDGRIIDRAANGWLDTEPAMDRLLEQLGLTDQIVPASPRAATRWVYAGGKMHPVPTTPMAFFRSGLISWVAKLRLLLEPFIPRGRSEESVAGFVRRRLGQAFVDRLVGPMVAGIYAAAPEQLSLRAAFPKMYEMEKKHRSLFLALLMRRGTGGGAAGPRGGLQTLTGGAGHLTDALADSLGTRIQCDCTVRGISPRGQGWTVHTDEGDVDTEVVVLACPAPAQASIVRGLDAALAAELDAIPYAPVSVVVSAWSAGAFDHNPEGFGVLVARDEDVGVLGTLFTSQAYPGQSLEGEILLRTMVGGAVDPEACSLPHPQLLERVMQAQQRFFGNQRAEPTMVRVYHHPNGIPQYTEGHPTRVGAVHAAQSRFPGLYFTGNHLDGIGVKDCVASAERIAADVRSWLDLTADEGDAV